MSTRYYYDCEFIERGPKYPIDLISIAIVSSDGREYYAQSSEFKMDRASQWVRDNVIWHLGFCRYGLTGEAFTYAQPPYDLRRHRPGCTALPERPSHAVCPWRTREQIKAEILTFMDIEKYGKPELWADFGAYDHVVFCQLFGTMMNLPRGFPMYTHDIKQWCDALGKPELPQQEVSLHHALADARWVRHLWQFLRDLEGKQ